MPLRPPSGAGDPALTSVPWSRFESPGVRLAACAAVVIVALAAFWPTSTVNYMFAGSEEPGPTFSARTPGVEQYLAPRTGAPVAQGWVAPELVARLSLALPFGTPLYRADVVNAIVQTVALALLFAVACRVSGSTIAALLATLALASSSTFWPRAAVSSSQSLVAVLLLGVIWAFVRTDPRPRPSDRWTAAGLYGAAIGGNPEVLLLAPGLLWWSVLGIAGRREQLRAALPIALATGLGFAHNAWAMAYVWDGASDLSKIGAVMAPGRAMAVSRGLLPSADVDLLDSAARVAGGASAEFGLLGIALIGVGCWRLTAVRRDWAIGLGAVSGIGLTWALLSGGGPQLHALPPVLWVAYPIVASGVVWFAEAVGPRARFVAIGLAALLPVSNVLVHHDVVTRIQHRQAFRAEHLDRVLDVLPPDAAVVAESPAFDRALIWMVAGRRREPLVRIPTGRTAASLARSTGAVVYGFDAGADGSPPDPFRWVHREVAPIELSLVQYLAMLPKGAIVVVGGARVAPGSAPGDTVSLETIGGRLDLAGGIPAGYGIVGVVGDDRPAVERLGSAAAGIRVNAGDPVGSGGLLSPVTIELSASSYGVRITVNGRDAVSAETGLAVAALNPLGSVQGAFVVDARGTFDTRWRLAPEPYRLD